MRRLRDFAVTLVVLAAVFAMLIMINPQVRERFGQMTGDVQSQQWSSSGGPIGQAAETAFTATSSYAADNPYLFTFAVAAVVLFMLMLRT